jgi:hypothetical protein
MGDMTFVDLLVWPMQGRGIMQNPNIYREFKRVSRTFAYKLPTHWDEEVRQTLQSHCVSRPQWNGRDDFFEFHRRGYWSCKMLGPELAEL